MKKTRLEAALQADTKYAMRDRLKVGELCPVCDRTITKLVAQRLGIIRRS